MEAPALSKKTTSIFKKMSTQRDAIPESKKEDAEDSLAEDEEDLGEDFEMEKVQMSEAELDEFLVKFKGLENEMSAEVKSTVGKLLLDDTECDKSAKSETYSQLF